jgi:hypothetical protein
MEKAPYYGSSRHSSEIEDVFVQTSGKNLRMQDPPLGPNPSEFISKVSEP